VVHCKRYVKRAAEEQVKRGNHAICILFRWWGIRFYSSSLKKGQRNFESLIDREPITVAARAYKTWTIFARSNTGIVGSNPIQGMDVFVHTVSVLGSGLATGWSPVKGVLHGISFEQAVHSVRAPKFTERYLLVNTLTIHVRMQVRQCWLLFSSSQQKKVV
jgi:hypothetical protein